MQISRSKGVTEFTVNEPAVTENYRSMVAEFTVSEPVVTEPVEVSNYRSMVVCTG